MAVKRNLVVVVCKPDQVADAKKYWINHGKLELLTEHDESKRMRVFIDTPTNDPDPELDDYDRSVLVFASKINQPAVSAP